MSQVAESALQDSAQYGLTVAYVRHTDRYSRYKFKLTCVANNQERLVMSTLSTDEIAELSSQTEKVKLDAAYAKALDNLRTIAHELAQESSHIGQNYFTTT